MADLLKTLLSSENGVSDLERGLAPLRLAAGPGKSGAAARSSALFDSEAPTSSDFAFHKEMSTLASLGGLLFPNAGRHLKHYLAGGTMGPIGIDAQGNVRPQPVPLAVNVGAMLDEIPGFREQVEDAKTELQTRIERELGTGRRPRQLKGRDREAGATAVTSDDWFYALGRFTFRVEATIAYEPATNGQTARAIVLDSVHVDDYYDWDRDAVTLPIPHPETGEEIVISDAQMRRLHVVGLAREYPIHGSSDLGSAALPLR